MLVFIDESGHPRPTDDATRPVILAVCIKESDVGRLTRAMFTVKRNLLGSLQLSREENEGKAIKFLSRRAITQISVKREYVDAMFDHLRDVDLAVFGIVMERPDRDPYAGPDFLQTHFRWLLERIDRFMENEHPSYMAIPIFDGQDPRTNQIFADCFTGFMAKSTSGRAMAHVVPTPLFVDSSLTPGIQISDWFAYVIRLYYEQGLDRTSGVTDGYLSAIKRYASIVRSKTIDYPRGDGFTDFGISTMDAGKFVFERPAAPPGAPVEPPEEAPTASTEAVEG
jgi:Protein of unknown function (DUF3800)